MEKEIKAMFEVGVDTRTLASVLVEAAVGDVVTYEKLSAAIDRDVRGVARSMLNGARNVVQREQNMIFDCVRKIGLRRLSDAEIVDLPDAARNRVKGIARRTSKKVRCADYATLAREDQNKYWTGLALAGVWGVTSTRGAADRLLAATAEVGAELPVAKAALAALGMKK